MTSGHVEVGWDEFVLLSVLSSMTCATRQSGRAEFVFLQARPALQRHLHL